MGRAGEGAGRDRRRGPVHAHGGDPSVQEGDGLTERVPIWSVGHGARSIAELLEILRGSAIELLVDVRTAPGSRKHPQFGRPALEASLREAGIGYEWRKDLGGFRRPRADSPHTALRSDTFRGYADHMETPEFEQALRWLIERSRSQRVAFMCAESLWWRCHRRMISDALLARGEDVRHLMGRGREEPHRLHPAARVEAERLVYDVQTEEQTTLEV